MKKILISAALASAFVFGSASCSKINTLEQQVEDLKQKLDETNSELDAIKDVVPFKILVENQTYTMCSTLERAESREFTVPYTIQGGEGDIQVFAEVQHAYYYENYPQVEITESSNTGGVLNIFQAFEPSHWEGDGWYFTYAPSRVILRAYSEDGRTAVTDFELCEESWYVEFYAWDIIEEGSSKYMTLEIDPDGGEIDYCYLSHYIYQGENHPLDLSSYEPTFDPDELIFFTVPTSANNWLKISIDKEPTDTGADEDEWYANYAYRIKFEANHTSATRTCNVGVCYRFSSNSYGIYGNIRLIQPVSHN